MIVKAIYLGLQAIQRVYRNGKIIFQNEPIVFHRMEDGKLIILGALSANLQPEGLYLDCAPEWDYPVKSGNVLTIERVYSATKNGNILEVE